MSALLEKTKSVGLVLRATRADTTRRAPRSGGGRTGNGAKTITQDRGEPYRFTTVRYDALPAKVDARLWRLSASEAAFDIALDRMIDRVFADMSNNVKRNGE